MIRTVAIYRAKYVNADQKWAIVRALKSPIQGFLHVPALSPNWDLFRTYRELAAAGQWDRQAFETIYTPRFLNQIAQDPAAQSFLDQLVRLDREGKTIALACFCKDKNLCHRSLVAQLLHERGCQVIEE